MSPQSSPVVAVTPWVDPPSSCGLCHVQTAQLLFVQMAHQTPRGGRFGNVLVCPRCFALALKLYTYGEDVPAEPAPVTEPRPIAAS